MVTKVRGRFKVGEVTTWAWNKRAALVKLESVEGEIPAADDTLTISTPSASIGMMITNPAVIDCFPLDQHFYVDFTPVEE
jgi:hypothetical protein